MTYEDNGFDKFLTRKTEVKSDKMLDDTSSLNIEAIESGSIGATVKNIRNGWDAALPPKGDKVGSIYFAHDTDKLYIWNGIKYVSTTLS
jgi:hypothetical protein